MWSTGVETLPFVKKLDIPKDERTGRILTDNKLRVKGYKDVYSIGDCAIIEDKFYPPIAQVADQQADYLAKTVFNGSIVNDEEAPNFRYLHKGSMA